MFDIGFWELALIGVIALLVVGPERLPALARNVGLWVGRMRRYVAHVREDIESEIHAEEMRKLIENPVQSIGQFDEAITETKSVIKDVEDQLAEVEREAGRLEDDVDDSFEAVAAEIEDLAADEATGDGPFTPENTERLAPTQDQPGAASADGTAATGVSPPAGSAEEKRHGES